MLDKFTCFFTFALIAILSILLLLIQFSSLVINDMFEVWGEGVLHAGDFGHQLIGDVQIAETVRVAKLPCTFGRNGANVWASKRKKFARGGRNGADNC